MEKCYCGKLIAENGDKCNDSTIDAELTLRCKDESAECESMSTSDSVCKVRTGKSCMCGVDLLTTSVNAEAQLCNVNEKAPA